MPLTDQAGQAISLGDVVALGGFVRRLEGDTVVIVSADGKHVMRAKGDEVMRLADIITRHSGTSRYFLTQAPASDVAAVFPGDLMRRQDFLDGQAIQDALFLAILAGYQPVDNELVALAAVTAAADKGVHFTGANTAATHDLTSLARTLLAKSDRREMAKTIGCPWVEANLGSGTAVGASSTAWHELFSFTIPADAMGDNGRASARLNIEGVAAAGQTRGRWLVNGTVVQDRQGGNWDNDTSVRYLMGEAHLVADGSDSAQTGYGWLSLCDEGGSTGTGGWLWDEGRGNFQFDDTTEDASSDVTLAFEMKFATSDAGNYFKRRSARLTIEPDV